MSTTVSAIYRDQRTRYPSYPAWCALRDAKNEIALREAESEDRVTFVWDYESYPDVSWMEDDEIQKVNDGEWEILVCEIQTLKTCPHCGLEITDEWESVGSLRGIVVDVDDKHDHRRQVERDLFAEYFVQS